MDDSKEFEQPTDNDYDDTNDTDDTKEIHDYKCRRCEHHQKNNNKIFQDYKYSN